MVNQISHVAAKIVATFVMLIAGFSTVQMDNSLMFKFIFVFGLSMGTWLVSYVATKTLVSSLTKEQQATIFKTIKS